MLLKNVSSLFFLALERGRARWKWNGQVWEFSIVSLCYISVWSCFLTIIYPCVYIDVTSLDWIFMPPYIVCIYIIDVPCTTRTSTAGRRECCLDEFSGRLSIVWQVSGCAILMLPCRKICVPLYLEPTMSSNDSDFAQLDVSSDWWHPFKCLLSVVAMHIYVPWHQVASNGLDAKPSEVHWFSFGGERISFHNLNIS